MLHFFLLISSSQIIAVSAIEKIEASNLRVTTLAYIIHGRRLFNCWSSLPFARNSSRIFSRFPVLHHYVIVRRFNGETRRPREPSANTSSRDVLIKRHPGAQVLVMTCQPDISRKNPCLMRVVCLYPRRDHEAKDRPHPSHDDDDDDDEDQDDVDDDTSDFHRRFSSLCNRWA